MYNVVDPNLQSSLFNRITLLIHRRRQYLALYQLQGLRPGKARIIITGKAWLVSMIPRTIELMIRDNSAIGMARTLEIKKLPLVPRKESNFEITLDVMLKESSLIEVISNLMSKPNQWEVELYDLQIEIQH